MPKSNQPAVSTEFSRRLTKARKNSEFSISDLSRHLGVNPKTIREWEAGRAEPRSNKLNTLAGLLGVSVGWLLAGGEQPEITDTSLKSELVRLRAIIDEAGLILDRIEAQVYQ